MPGTAASSAVLDETDLNDLNDLHLYEVDEVVRMTKLPRTWLTRRAGEKRIPCSYLGKYLRFSADDIRELIAMHRIDPKTGLPRQASKAA
ncbi:helix-turn-helix domain-containing protein [Embleya sp. NPDC050154]|uniref:helix-turn-helix domain-containing protein n=1 Tax=Embleya sp. NPDC050154 TaxID=3363988 RepID=UPI0037B306FB